MAITNIKRIHNAHTKLVFTVENHHNPRDTEDPSSEMAKEGGWFIHDIWVPWCASQQDFDNGAFISITSAGVSFSIWQQNCPDLDGDQVRYSTDGAYHPCGESNRVPNDSVAGGDRDVEISGSTNEDATITFNRHR
jgi:hypothetical protein